MRRIKVDKYFTRVAGCKSPRRVVLCKMGKFDVWNGSFEESVGEVRGGGRNELIKGNG